MTAPPALPPDLARLVEGALAENRPVAQGVVQSKLGLAIEVAGLRAAIGNVCTVHPAVGTPVPAEVVGFHDGTMTLMALGEQDGVAPLDRVTNTRKAADGDDRRTDCSAASSTRSAVRSTAARRCWAEERRVTSAAPPALERQPIREVFATGVSAIDGFVTCGRGQRLGLFAGSGVGKSTLLGMVARGASSDVNVIALIGERGREVREFVEDVLGPEGLARSVVVVATSDSPPMLRFKGPYTAVTIAEAFREAGRHVLFMMDSMTRFAGAAREIGLAAGEPPTLRGYPPSLFAHMPRLVERLGNDGNGTITGLLAVLVDGDDLNEPVSDALRGYLDGHVVLDRRIAARGKFPAIDVLGSVSRLMPHVTATDHRAQAAVLREWLAHFEENRDLIQVGAYRHGSDPVLDKALQKVPQIEELLYQGADPREFAATRKRVADLAGLAVVD